MINIEAHVNQRDLSRVTSKLNQAHPKIKRNMREVMEYSGKNIMDEARNIVPVRSGDLKNSITYDANEKQSRIYVPDSSAAGKYAIVVNNGKGHGRLFIKRAFIKEHNNVSRKLEETAFKGIYE